MEILYLSQCVPNPPDKGERIRSHHEFMHLSSRHRVHLACFARDPQEMDASEELRSRCASFYVERLNRPLALGRAAMRFAIGGSLTASYYSSPRMAGWIADLVQNVKLDATFAFSSVAAALAPADIPLLADLVDVDSEKWLQYSGMRRAGFAYRMEGRRLRELEIQVGGQARACLFATSAEAELYRNFAPGVRNVTVENGIDTKFFDPAATGPKSDSGGRRYAVFVGVMDYFPNVDAVVWFASEILPLIRKRDPRFEFVIVGRNPSREVRALTKRPGVRVTGGVPDIRPYLAGARCFAASFRMTRGIQNKVLEALAMGKPVFASMPVCRTFGGDLPSGVTPCETASDFAFAILQGSSTSAREMRMDVQRRFCWTASMEKVSIELDAAVEASRSNQGMRVV
ncbi:MAG TPA: TIGR03087 family PEP-CTERM/XrtA system glycosyltransferase [Bryobacteraceae bacterium]|nr:TIGR03087 family PEP-CTERM/XrtA system glycosyltransferase [Bryobacteraceae bacterium]